MKKKVLSAFLLAGALVVAPVGSGFLSGIASASSNNSAGAGSSSSSNNTVKPAPVVTSTVQEDVSDRIADAKSGDVIEITGVTSLSNGNMKELSKKSNVTLVMKYTYKDVNYVITIPSGEALDDDVEWYGPLYLAAHFGNGVKAAKNSSYIVRSGDTMMKIAQANSMTLAELVKKNPQIANPNLIRVGEEIKIK